MTRYLTATVDDQRLVDVLRDKGKIPANSEYLIGLKLLQTVDEENRAGLSVVLGPLNGGRGGRKPAAIPVSIDPAKQPVMKNGRLLQAGIEIVGDSYEFVKPTKSNVALRIIKTGLLATLRGDTTEDFGRIAASGRPLRYHGAFPLTADAADVVGEGLDFNITNASRVIVDERFGSINGLAGIPKFREVTVEGVVGGPILVGQIDGVLKIHELTTDGWKVHDVTGSKYWQDMFMTLAQTDMRYLADLEAASKLTKKRERKFRVVQLPVGHPDA
jgi:hypothetical protein